MEELSGPEVYMHVQDSLALGIVFAALDLVAVLQALRSDGRRC